VAYVGAASSSHGAIREGSCVRVRDADGSELELTIVPPEEADPARSRISAQAPVAQAILGRRAMDRVRVATPGGLRELLIVVVR